MKYLKIKNTKLYITKEDGEITSIMGNGTHIYLCKDENGIQIKSMYTGEFSDGLRQGNGVWKKDVNDSKSTEYEGNFDQDFRNGYGEMRWNDGSVYRGNWIKGKQDGYGEYTRDGELYEGIFKDNVYIGKSELEEIKENDYDDSQYQTKIEPAKVIPTASQISMKKKLKPIKTDESCFTKTKPNFGNKRFKTPQKPIRIRSKESLRK